MLKDGICVQYQCYHHNKGNCKFGDQYRYPHPHFKDICKNRICTVKECCKHCKFNKINICAFIQKNYPLELESQISRLQREIDILKNQIEEK